MTRHPEIRGCRPGAARVYRRTRVLVRRVGQPAGRVVLQRQSDPQQLARTRDGHGDRGRERRRTGRSGARCVGPARLGLLTVARRFTPLTDSCRSARLSLAHAFRRPSLRRRFAPSPARRMGRGRAGRAAASAAMVSAEGVAIRCRRPATLRETSFSCTACRRTRACGTRSRSASPRPATKPPRSTCARTARATRPTTGTTPRRPPPTSRRSRVAWASPARWSPVSRGAATSSSGSPPNTRTSWPPLALVDGGWFSPADTFDSWASAERRMRPPDVDGQPASAMRGSDAGGASTLERRPRSKRRWPTSGKTRTGRSIAG